MNELSLKNYCVFKDLKGLQIIQTTDGYGKIFDLIFEKDKQKFLPRLKLNKSLEKILICKNHADNYLSSELCEHCKYTHDDNKIVLILNDEINKKKNSVICENVILTASLGFLKENLKDLIEPKRIIPNNKLTAVSRLGYGTVNKVI